MGSRAQVSLVHPHPKTDNKVSRAESWDWQDWEVCFGKLCSCQIYNKDSWQSAEKVKANDDAFDSLFQDTNKATDTTDDASETAEVEKKLDEVNKSEENKKSSPIIKMSFVDESASTELEKNGDKKETGEENKEDSDKMDTMEKSAEEKEEESVKKKEESSEEKKDSKESDKPTLKLASFSTMSTSTENGHSEENEDGCYSCSKLIPNLYEAIVWETMQFCDEVEIFFILNMNWILYYAFICRAVWPNTNQGCQNVPLAAKKYNPPVWVNTVSGML